MTRPTIVRAVLVLALAASLAGSLAGCKASPSYEQQQDALENAAYEREAEKVQADYYRSVERQREQETRRIVREELERQQPKGLRP